MIEQRDIVWLDHLDPRVAAEIMSLRARVGSAEEVVKQASDAVAAGAIDEIYLSILRTTTCAHKAKYQSQEGQNHAE